MDKQDLSDPAVLLQAGFLAAAISILFVAAIPPLSNRFLAYGPREAQAPTKPTASSNPLAALAALRVPHDFFAHFYLLSLTSTVIWAQQLLTLSGLTHLIGSLVSPARARTSTPIEAICVLLGLLTQCARRWSEETRKLRTRGPSTSKMWVGHYFAGLAFYAAANMAAWIEAAGYFADGPADGADIVSAAFLFQGRSQLHLVKLAVLLQAMLWLQRRQAEVHSYLIALPKGPDYVLPRHPAFKWTVTPHYACEVGIYACLVGMGSGTSVNKTLATMWVFVVVNLGVTAVSTRSWWKEKFGEESVNGKARMIPFVW